VGTDIFIYAERKEAEQWHLLTYNQTDQPIMRKEWPSGTNDLYEERNYDLFAILADVTNSPNETETQNSRRYEPIATRRGFPNDLSPELRALIGEERESDRASWLLLRELLEFDWYGKTVQKHKQVGQKLAEAYEHGYNVSPYRWQWLQDIPGSDPGWMHGNVSVRWTETYADSVGKEFMQSILDRLREYGNPNDVRIVFWFWS